MDDRVTVLAGIVIPSDSPVFLSIVAVHVVIAIGAVLSGATAMLSPKGSRRHTRFGKIYFWSLVGVSASASVLSFMRWPHTYHLFLIGSAALAMALIARTAVRARWRYWARIHLLGMGSSYTMMLVAFYVDNGRNLPLWGELPSISYWLVPLAAGSALIALTLFRHPLTRRSSKPSID